MSLVGTGKMDQSKVDITWQITHTIQPTINHCGWHTTRDDGGSRSPHQSRSLPKVIWSAFLLLVNAVFVDSIETCSQVVQLRHKNKKKFDKINLPTDLYSLLRVLTKQSYRKCRLYENDSMTYRVIRIQQLPFLFLLQKNYVHPIFWLRSLLKTVQWSLQKSLTHNIPNCSEESKFIIEYPYAF